MESDNKLPLNINIGILGHVDSGKTTLAKALSEISSTAAFDKNPQSQERGITLDLGFSAMTITTKTKDDNNLSTKMNIDENNKNNPSDALMESIQYTFVDCPGHASLIRTVIGGTQIIDLIFLVIDITKGIQTQTAECLIIGQLIRKPIIIILNKIDLLQSNEKRSSIIEKFTKKMQQFVQRTAGTTAGLSTSQETDPPVIIPVSAMNRENLLQLKQTLISYSIKYLPKRVINAPCQIAVDHCFAIKGQGTICTGTILQGKLRVGDELEIPTIKEVRKIKSIQMFRKSRNSAMAGDRIGICINHFDPSLLERGVLATSGYMKHIHMTIFNVNLIKYFKFNITSKSKYHFSIGYETVMGQITLFTTISGNNKNSTKEISNNNNNNNDNPMDTFNWEHEYEYLPSINYEEYNMEMENDEIKTNDKHIFVLVKFDKPVIVAPNSLILATKLDIDINQSTLNQCRLAFSGHLDVIGDDGKEYGVNVLNKLKVFKYKKKIGTIQRVINANELICDNLFKKESNRQLFIGMHIQLSTNEWGVIDSTFGATTKIRLRFDKSLSDETMDKLKNGKPRDIQVILRFKKYLWDSQNKIVQ